MTRTQVCLIDTAAGHVDTVDDVTALVPDQAVHGEGVWDDGRYDNDSSNWDGVDDLELGKDGDVRGLFGGVHGGGHDGGDCSQAGVELGHGEYLVGDNEVGDEETGDDDDPGPDREEGGHQAQGDSSVWRVQEEERSGSEVGQPNLQMSVWILRCESTIIIALLLYFIVCFHHSPDWENDILAQT